MSKGPSVREMAIGGHKVHRIRSLCKRDALPHAAAKDKDLPLIRLDWSQLNAKPGPSTRLAWDYRAGARYRLPFPTPVLSLPAYERVAHTFFGAGGQGAVRRLLAASSGINCGITGLHQSASDLIAASYGCQLRD